jgi:hypothetical protein
LEVEGRYLHAGGAQMFGRFRHKRFIGGLAVGLLDHLSGRDQPRPQKCIAALGGNRFDQARVIIPRG